MLARRLLAALAALSATAALTVPVVFAGELSPTAKPGPAPAAKKGDAAAEKRYDPDNVTALSRFMETLIQGNAAYSTKNYAGAYIGPRLGELSELLNGLLCTPFASIIRMDYVACGRGTRPSNLNELSALGQTMRDCARGASVETKRQRCGRARPVRARVCTRSPRRAALSSASRNPARRHATPDFHFFFNRSPSAANGLCVAGAGDLAEAPPAALAASSCR